MKNLTCIFLLVFNFFFWGHTQTIVDESNYNLGSTDGPYYNWVNAILNYSDSLIFCYNKVVGLYKTSDLGNTWHNVPVNVLSDAEITRLVKHNNGNIFATTTMAGIIRSTDLGNNWLTTPTTQFGVVSYLYSSESGDLFLAGQTSSLYKSTNLGQTWSQISIPLGKIKAMTESLQGTLFVVSGNSLYRSTNGGLAWISVMSNLSSEVVFLTRDNFNAIYIATMGLLKRSFDNGLTWSTVGYQNWNSYFSTVSVSSDSLIFVGSIISSNNFEAGIWSSFDYGTTFYRYGLLFTSIKYSFMYNEQVLIAVNTKGIYKNGFYKIDSGIKKPDVIDLSASFSNSSFAEVVAVCDSMGIFNYKSSTGWQPFYETFPFKQKISSSYISTFSLIGTKDRGLWRSSDNGQSWAQINLTSNNNTEIFSLKSKNDSLILCASRNEGIFISSDMGISWNKSSNGLPVNFIVEAIDMTNQGLCFLSTANNGLFSSSNGVNDWSAVQQSFTDTSKVVSISLTGVYILVATKNNGIFRSFDFGKNWTKMTSGLPSNLNNPLVKIHTSNNGYIIGDAFVYFSSDFGETWSGKYAIPAGVKITSVATNNYAPLYFGADDGNVYKGWNDILPVELSTFAATYSNKAVELKWSTATELNNNGFEIERSFDKTNWATIGFVKGKGTTSEPQNYSYSDNLSEISLTKLYYRLKQIDFNGSYEYSEVVEVEVMPSVFSLSQNYPNPFNPSTKISWQSPVGSWQTLKVYDILGNEVATLVNEYRNPGNYEVDFQSSVGSRRLANGVYFYRLQVGDFIETKKMILLK